MHKILLSLATLQLAACSVISLTSSSTAPATPTPTLYPLHMVEKFDYSSDAEGPIGDVVILGGINYAPFEYRFPVGLRPQSPPKAIVYNPLDPYSSVFRPTWSCFMGDSITDHFDLHSFYFGCALATKDGLENKTRSCDVTVAAYTESGGAPFAQQTFSFGAAYGNWSQPMVQASLDGFTGVYELAFTVEGKPEAPTGMATALVVDNVDVTIFTTEPFTRLY